MNSARNNQSLNFAVSMTLFAVFAFFLTLVLISGASSFRGISDAVEERYEERTLLLYVSQKIRMSDNAGQVEVFDFGGVSTLRLATEYQHVYVYLKDGSLAELHVWLDDEPDFSLGSAILPADEVLFEKVSPSLIKITISGNTTYVSISSREVAA